MLDVSGIWRGVYTYDSARVRDQVPFEIRLQMDPAGAFQGSVQDDTRFGGHPRPGVIVGQVTADGHITFSKRMPSRAVIMSDQSRVFDESSGYEILYEGVARSEDTFDGTWRIPRRVGCLLGLLALMGGNTGTWSMTRVKDNTPPVVSPPPTYSV